MTSRLALRLSPSTRTIWASAQAQQEWSRKLKLAAKAWLRVEYESVAVGLRPCGQQWLSFPETLQFMAWASRHGVLVSIARFTGKFEGFTHAGYPDGQDQAVVVFGRDSEHLKNPTEHLGYPVCCQTAFSERFPVDPDPVPGWVAGGLTTVQQQTWAGVPRLEWSVSRSAVKRGLGMPLLRYAGVRCVPHIPCQVGCPATEAQANNFLALMTAEEQDATLSCMGLPITWDRYRGIAIITTPYFRIVSTSTEFAHREVIHVLP